MFSLNNFKDEKFRDTIKKNYCRLRQNSSKQLGEFLTSQTHYEYQTKIQKEDKTKEINNKIKDKNTINSKYKKYNQSKIYIKRPIKEDKQIYIKKKKTEENNNSNIPLKQRILMKLKEERNEKIKNNNTEKSVNIDCFKDNAFKNSESNHRRNIASMDLNNIINRNKNNMNFASTINNDEKKNLRNIDFNIEKNLIIKRNVKNLSSNGNKTIYELRNDESKFNNFYKKEIYLTHNKTENKEKSELKNFNKSSLIHKINFFNFNSDELTENLTINKNRKHIINNKLSEKLFVNEKENYFTTKINYVNGKNEEEKNKNMNDKKAEKNITLNKTFAKPYQNISFFSDNYTSDKLSKINIHHKFKNNNSLKFESTNNDEYSTKNKIEIHKNVNINKKKYIHLPTEKPHLFTKSTLFRNLMINTDYNINKFNRKIIDKNITKLRNITELSESKEDLTIINKNIQNKINNNYNNILNSPTSLTSRSNKIVFSELLKKDTDIQKLNESSTIKKELYNSDYIIKMIIEAIQLNNSIEAYSLFSILLLNFNNRYIVSYEQKKFIKESQIYLNCYKYLSIFIIPLIFFYKDENIYKINCSEVKKIFENLIYICIEKFGQQAYKYKKIFSFNEEFKKKLKYIEIFESMEECCFALVKVVFKNYKEYIPLKKITEQLIELSFTENLENIISIINNTILYCFNNKQKNKNYYLFGQFPGTNTYRKNKSSNKDSSNLNKALTIPSVPYIKTSMKKNFCLVLDIDETIVHTMNLPSENYFLLRPGVINFLEEIYKIYEIVIFTSSPKNYADSILNKIDKENKYFSHRLYKEHVIFEKGKSVKKLNLIGRDLNKIIFVDNMKCNAKYNLKNLYLIPTWISNINDQELIKLKMKLKYIATNTKFKDDITKGLEQVI